MTVAQPVCRNRLAKTVIAKVGNDCFMAVVPSEDQLLHRLHGGLQIGAGMALHRNHPGGGGHGLVYAGHRLLVLGRPGGHLVELIA